MPACNSSSPSVDPSSEILQENGEESFLVINQLLNKMIDDIESKKALDGEDQRSVSTEKRPATPFCSNSPGKFTDPICLQQSMLSSINANQLVEYQWPLDGDGEYYLLQEQISAFLNVTSFKRKYPEILRRKLTREEINYLLTNHLISEVQVTHGLTALRSSDVCDMMIREYPARYKEYSEVMQEREKKRVQQKYQQYAANQQADKLQTPSFLKRAMRQAAIYNANLNRRRRTEFAVYYDQHTNALQLPANKVRKLDPELTRPSLYPCALIPGQFQEYCKAYKKDELMYLPVNTALYGPPQPSACNPDSSGTEDSDEDSVSTVSTLNKSEQYDAEKLKINGQVERSSNQPEQAQKQDLTSVQGSKDLVKSDGEEDTELRFVCGICNKDETCNKQGNAEELIQCSECDNRGHPSCLQMSDELVGVVQTYNWQCMECKTCTICSKPHREDLMMFCDRCDRGFHTFCVSLRAIPAGVWTCSRCVHEDPKFKTRRRKELRGLQSGGCGETPDGRRQKSGSSPDKRQTIIIDMDPTVRVNDLAKMNGTVNSVDVN